MEWFLWFKLLYSSFREALLLFEQPLVGIDYNESRRLSLDFNLSFDSVLSMIGLTASPFLKLFCFSVDTAVQWIAVSLPVSVMYAGGL